jgi:LDH2 family malate/lactate/ureidoglycolate dehydrogenase
MVHVIGVERLQNLSNRFLMKAGAPPAIAERVAHALVLSSLKGVDSHGVMRLPQYLEQIQVGAVVPDALPEIVRETASTAVVDGQRGFGHVGAEFSTRIALEKARTHDLSAVTLHNTRHIGRVGEYVEMAVEAGFAGFAFCSAISQVAPHGGRGRVLGTNPVAIGLPSDGEFPFVLDFATSVLSEGKVRVARDKGVDVQPGAILDAEGQPSTTPQDLYEGGSLLPLGTYKGYGLSLAVQILGSLLAQGGTLLLDQPQVGNGALFMILKPEAFCDPVELRQQTEELCQAVRTSPLRDGFDEILIPGEPEYRAERQRIRDGVPIADATWRHWREAGLGIGMDPGDFEADS